jgi:DNA-binding CsgD family transcriptional regulator
VLATGQPVWSDALDRQADPRRIGATSAAGLVTGLAFPVLVRSEVAGVVEFFHTEKVPADGSLLELLRNVGTQLGRVIERSRAQQERLALIEQAQRAEEEAIAAKRRLVLEKLSAREQDVMRFLAIGADNLKIAAHLGITERTVKAHITSLLRKLQLENRTQIAVLALGIGIAGPTEVPPEPAGGPPNVPSPDTVSALLERAR